MLKRRSFRDRYRTVVGILGLVVMSGSSLQAQDSLQTPRAVAQPTALATWDSLIGVTVRFPRRVSPDSITREMPVMDLFGSYEWRIILVAGSDILLNAFVIPPTSDLRLHRYVTIAEAFAAGSLRRCDKAMITFNCTKIATALMRDVGGQMEITISDLRWISILSKSKSAEVLLVVKRGGEDLLYQSVPLRYAQWSGFSQQPQAVPVKQGTPTGGSSRSPAGASPLLLPSFMAWFGERSRPVTAFPPSF